MSPKILTILQGLNLNSGEQQAYIALLTQGELAVKDLSEIIGESRPNTYAIVNKLVQKNLVILSGEKYGKKVILDSVNKLSSLIRLETDNLKNIQSELTEILPELEHLQNNNPNLPATRYLFGEKGLAIALDEVLNNPEALRIFSNQESEKLFISRSVNQSFLKSRIEKNLRAKVLTVNNTDGLKLAQEDKRFLRETKVLPSNFSFTAETYILKNQLVVIGFDTSKKRIQCSQIQSTELANLHRMCFDFIWSKI